MAKKIVIESPARIHLGLVNPFNREYRLYMSAGVAINYPNTLVSVYPGEQLNIEGCRGDEVRKRLEPLIEELGLRKGRVVIEKCIPKHVGLGSTTQLLLSVAHGLLLANNLTKFDLVEIAKRVGIGKISGVGTYVYLHGGFVVDAGKSRSDEFPKLLLRVPFPEEWVFLVVVPRGEGLDERAEEGVFTSASGSRHDLVWQASFVLFHELVPALINRDFDGFSKSLARLQEVVGSMFSQYQGGVFAYYSTRAIEVLKSSGLVGVGQSSWGPAVYGVVDSLRKAEDILSKMRGWIDESLVFIARPRNTGAKVFYEVY